MNTLTQLQANMKNSSEYVTITFPRGKNAIKYVTKNAVESNAQGDGKHRWLHEFSLLSVGVENGDVLELKPFDYGKTSGGAEIQESMDTIIEYWVRYAEMKGLNKITLSLTSTDNSTHKFWENGERVMAARRLGFRVRQSIQNKYNRTYNLELKLSDYRAYDEQVKQFESALDNFKLQDSSVFFQDMNLSMGMDMVRICGAELPFYARKMSWYGYDGYVCLRNDHSRIVAEFYSADHILGSAPALSVEAEKGKEEEVVEMIKEFITDNRKIRNLIDVPAAMLSRYYQSRFSIEEANEIADSVMESLLGVGHEFIEVEKEIGEILNGGKIVEEGRLYAGPFCYEHIKLAGKYVVIQLDAEKKNDRWNKSFLFKNKKEMAEHMKETVESAVYGQI